MDVPDNGDKRFEKILQGIQYLIRDSEDRREELKEFYRQAAEDRKQAAEDRKQAAEDRREMNENIRGIRKALVVIGKRAAEFIEVQKKLGEKLDRNTEILERIEKKFFANGKKNGNSPK